MASGPAKNSPTRGSYDVVVIGSGVGGLSAAALLAKAGKSVLVVERHNKVGGCAHGFERDGYFFDVGVHLAAGAWGLLDLLLRYLGARDRCRLISIEPFYRAVFPDLVVDAPISSEGFIDVHSRHFPGQAAGIRALMDASRGLVDEMFRIASDLRPLELALVPLRFPGVFKHRNRTLGQMLDRHLSDPRAKGALSALWTYAGTPPSRISFLTWTMTLLSYLDNGAYYCEGGFQRIPDALAAVVEQSGGDVVVKNGAAEILLDGRRARGIRLDNGETVAAPVIVSNAPARETLGTLIPKERLPRRLVRKLGELEPSLSAYILYIATDLEIGGGAAHEIMVYRKWDQDEIWRECVAGRPGGTIVTIPTLADPSLAPPGAHVISVMSLLSYQAAAGWTEEQEERYVDGLLADAELVCPGLRSRIVRMDRGSPRAIERFTGNPEGAVYGWDNTPGQSGPGRPGHRTAIDGLYLSGHWSAPAGGIVGVMTSGAQTTQQILGYPNFASYMKMIESAV
jgi:prolycopene isomerase